MAGFEARPLLCPSLALLTRWKVQHTEAQVGCRDPKASSWGSALQRSAADIPKKGEHRSDFLILIKK